jgi:hypothetical protein
MGHKMQTMAVSKMVRETNTSVTNDDEDLSFDFGEPEVISVEISPGKFLTLKEPSANDLIEISKISDNKNISEVEATLQTICILHQPDQGDRKLSLKDAKRLRAKQLRKLGVAINELLGMDEEQEE